MGNHYDLAIVGMGCAGSHVVLELIRRQTGLKVVVLDDFKAGSLDKTWSYWEKGPGPWDHLITHRWDQGKFIMPQEVIHLDLRPYAYKTLESRDFIAFAKAELEQQPGFTWIDAQVTSLKSTNAEAEKASHEIHWAQGSLTATRVLDSRMPKDFTHDQKAITLLQHFKGWVIRTEEDCFDPEAFTMMDYRLTDPGSTNFTYVLPLSTKEALVEFTYFSKHTVAEKVYEQYLNTYIEQQLGLTEYEVTKTEEGIIPMTTYNFAQHHSQQHFKIGTAGGWVKPSTGYSFKMSEKKARKLVDNLISHRPLTQGLGSNRFHFYDAIMLDVLYQNNHKGADIFYTLYKKNKVPKILAFLDEESSFRQEVSIMFPMTSWPFIKAFLKKLFGRF